MLLRGGIGHSFLGTTYCDFFQRDLNLTYTHQKQRLYLEIHTILLNLLQKKLSKTCSVSQSTT